MRSKMGRKSCSSSVGEQERICVRELEAELGSLDKEEVQEANVVC